MAMKIKDAQVAAKCIHDRNGFSFIVPPPTMVWTVLLRKSVLRKSARVCMVDLTNCVPEIKGAVVTWLYHRKIRTKNRLTEAMVVILGDESFFKNRLAKKTKSNIKKNT